MCYIQFSGPATVRPAFRILRSAVSRFILLVKPPSALKEDSTVISGVHAILYSRHADSVRAFLSEVLEFPSVDAGGGWPIFAGPPLELAVHPIDGDPEHELYLMCDDVYGVTAKLAERGVVTTMPITDRGWGLVTQLRLPDGDEIGLYEPRHPSPMHRQAVELP
jgi:hypothetical protein